MMAKNFLRFFYQKRNFSFMLFWCRRNCMPIQRSSWLTRSLSLVFLFLFLSNFKHTMTSFPMSLNSIRWHVDLNWKRYRFLRRKGIVRFNLEILVFLSNVIREEMPWDRGNDRLDLIRFIYFAWLKSSDDNVCSFSLEMTSFHRLPVRQNRVQTLNKKNHHFSFKWNVTFFS